MNRSAWSSLLASALVLAACSTTTPPVDTVTFRNTTSITIPAATTTGPADPYPSTILVADRPAVMTTVTVRLNVLSHEWPDDLDVLLVGPGGQHTLLLSDAGGANEVTNLNLIFDQSAATSVPDSGPLVSGTFRPSAYVDGDTFDAPAPAGPYGADLSVFDGTDPNGTWSLYVRDDTGADVGTIAGGWSLTFPGP